MIESAMPYKLIQDFKIFEVREYAPHFELCTEVDGEHDGALLTGYHLLMQYLEGENQTHSSFEFAPPLLQKQILHSRRPNKQSLKKIDLNSGDSHLEQSLHVPPPQRFLLSLPLQPVTEIPVPPSPKNSALQLIRVARKRCAALKYSGLWSYINFHKHWIKLRAALLQRGWTEYSEPTLARYDSPLWPWFLRHNEVLVDLGRIELK